MTKMKKMIIKMMITRVMSPIGIQTVQIMTVSRCAGEKPYQCDKHFMSEYIFRQPV